MATSGATEPQGSALSAVDALIAKFQKAADQRPIASGSPESFDQIQRKVKEDSTRGDKAARSQAANFRASMRSAVAIVKPRNVSNKVTKEKWWRRKKGSQNKDTEATPATTNPMAESPTCLPTTESPSPTTQGNADR
jgi:hypothetical protein